MLSINLPPSYDWRAHQDEVMSTQRAGGGWRTKTKRKKSTPKAKPEQKPSLLADLVAYCQRLKPGDRILYSDIETAFGEQTPRAWKYMSDPRLPFRKHFDKETEGTSRAVWSRNEKKWSDK